MSITRRGILGGFATLLATPKNLLSQRAGGFVPSARRIYGESILPATYIRGSIETRNPLVSNVLSNVSQYDIFYKNNLEPLENSEDTSIIYDDFGVSIYTDPSGIFTNENIDG